MRHSHSLPFVSTNTSVNIHKNVEMQAIYKLVSPLEPNKFWCQKWDRFDTSRIQYR